VLESWNDTAATQALVAYVEEAANTVPPEARIAVFDNDGTLWCEKPMPVELGFILARFAELAEQDPALRTKQPWQAAYERDYAWLGNAMTKHYDGDDTDVKTLIGALLAAFEGTVVEDYQAASAMFVREQQHPTLQRAFASCSYVPMIELLRYLEANGFTTFIASGGDRDFMRAVTREIYGIPPERVIGSSSALRYENGAISYQATLDTFDDGPAKPVRIWSRIGRRPALAGGNSNGDIPMLEYATGFRLLVLHDDPEREFDYVSGADRALARCRDEGWTVVSVRDDWARVFA
jgi:phosphoglycolate phosphatase-like HAD superfamily hydrolase